MRVAVLFSGGKDSTLAAWLALSQGWKVACLLTMLSEKTDSFMFHRPNVEWCGLQAEAMGLKGAKARTSGEREREVADLKRALAKIKRAYHVDGVVSGALASEYQKEKIDGVCEELGLKSFAPLWHKDGEAVLRELVSAGWEIFVSAVAAEGLGKEWLGRRLDEKAIDELAALHRARGIHVGLEGGEGETFVAFAPGLFRRRVKITRARPVWTGSSGAWLIERAVLA
ncbi:MAG: diphthine--ammonia ligase [Candidatus Micrarchaeia archaeon]